MDKSSGVIYKGYLHKLTPLGWSERFFYLTRTQVFSYMHDKDPQAHKTLVVEFEIAPTTIVEEVFGSHLHGLRVYDAAASLQLFAHTENERIQWQERLHTAIQAMSKSVLHSPGASTADSTPKTCVAVREELSHKQLTRRLSSHRVMGREFVLEERYEFAKPIGQGAYGVVVSCVDKLTGKHVAVKKIAGVFEDIRDARKVLREIRLMRSLTHPNVLFLEDILDPLDHEFKDLYLITELMSTDLRKVIKRLSDSHQVLSENRQRFLMYQLLCGLEHLHLSGIIHRDIKPANILLSSSNISSGCVLKICDFGLARVQHTPSLNDFTRNMTEYVVTRWYRAPEIMLSFGRYTAVVDVWAAGCIFAEMQLGEPLFKAKSVPHQLESIVQVLGSLTEYDLRHIQKRREQDFMRRLPQYSAIPFQDQFPLLSVSGRELLKHMLSFRPHTRITAHQALASNYFNPVRDVAVESLQPSVVEADDIERCPLETLQLRALIAQEIYVLKYMRTAAEVPTGATTSPASLSRSASPHSHAQTESQTGQRSTSRSSLPTLSSTHGSALPKALTERKRVNCEQGNDEQVTTLWGESIWSQQHVQATTPMNMSLHAEQSVFDC